MPAAIADEGSQQLPAALHPSAASTHGGDPDESSGPGRGADKNISHSRHRSSPGSSSASVPSCALWPVPPIFAFCSSGVVLLLRASLLRPPAGEVQTAWSPKDGSEDGVLENAVMLADPRTRTHVFRLPEGIAAGQRQVDGARNAVAAPSWKAFVAEAIYHTP